MALDIQTVAQPQRPELVLRELAGEKTSRLIAKLGDALGDQGLVDVVVAVHSPEYTGAAPLAVNTRWFGGRRLRL